MTDGGVLVLPEPYSVRSFSRVSRLSFRVDSQADWTSGLDIAVLTPVPMVSLSFVRRPGIWFTDSGIRCSIELRSRSVTAPLTASSLAIA